MRTSAPALLPIFRSEHQARLLARLFLHPGAEFTLTDLSKSLEVSSGALHAEVERLVASGLLLDKRIGRSRLIRANTGSRFAPALKELLNLSYGPSKVIGEEFADLEDVDLVIIFGSWARRDAGEIGKEPADIDVMVVGAPARELVYAAADCAQERLDIPVNPVVRSSRAWREGSDPVVVTAKRSAYRVVVGNEAE